MAARHEYEIFIRASVDRVWEALTDPMITQQYFHGTRLESTLEPGSEYRYLQPDGSVAVDGVIETVDQRQRLTMSWHFRYDAAMDKEPPSHVEWKLASANDDNSVTRVSLRHGALTESPLTWATVRLGWVQIIDSLKTLLETGQPLPPVEMHDLGTPSEAGEIEAGWHRSQAILANNAAGDLLEMGTESVDADNLLASAHTAAYHWARASGRSPANAARASWLLSRCYAVCGHGELALRHADRCAAVVTDAGLVDFDLGYAREARARALACLGRFDEARTELAAARSTEVADPEDLQYFTSDLESEPWFGIVL